MPRTNVGRNALKVVGQGALGCALGSNELMHPNLGLHGAAASGNIGLIKFALENGQPANSNLNGILPLHAACSSGNEQAVRMLLLYGADVNAPRLKSKNYGGGAGVEGSTPLHFAAANGHLEIVRILLEAGARPAATDKDGTQAEALAAGNGHSECVKLLRSWISAYGTNGLAGIVSARDTVRRDLPLVPASYSRFTGHPAATAEDYAGSKAGGVRDDGGALHGQRSFDQLAWATTATRSSAGSRNVSGLLKTSSNPNLKGAPGGVTSSGAQQAQGSVLSPGQPPMITSPSTLHRHLPERSPSPLDPAEESELAFSAAATPAAPNANGGVASTVGFGGGKEYKRRPSLPSILEKAAHPAASLRAALGAGPSGTAGSEQPELGPPHSPNRKFGKLASKRSLSNMLRKATGTEKPSVSSSSSSSSLAPSTPHENGLISSLTPSRPPRSENRSYDTMSPQSTSRVYDRGDAAGRSTTAPHYRTAFSEVPARSDAAAGGASNAQPPRLRGSASSSALSASVVARNASRARSSSNEQVVHAGKPVCARLPAVGKASLDIARAEQLYPVRPSPATESSAGGGVKRMTGQTASAAGPRQTSTGSATSTGLPQRRRNEDATQQEHEISSDFTSSDGSLSYGLRGRAGSQSSQPSLRGDASTESRSYTKAAQGVDVAETDDDQEFLGDMVPMSPEEAAGEHHDLHHLPAGLRTLSAMRGPRQESSNGRTAGLGSTGSEASSSTSMLPIYGGRNRSTSSLSAVSATAHPLDGAHLRDSPGLQAASHELSIAEEAGMAHPTARASRSGSHAESVSSRPSTSSLRSTYFSAAEQAQAILNQDVQLGGEGTDDAPMSLAAQLAAYGEALAQERKRAGDTRSGPSPSLSGRASSAALKPALPSVREDQSPTTTSPTSVRRHLGAPVGGNHTGHSYSRRLSRRPHSSEGAESQSAAGKHAGFHTNVLRSKAIHESAQHPDLRNLFLHAPTTPNMEATSGTAASKALGSPLSPRPPVSAPEREEAAPRTTRQPGVNHQPSSGNGSVGRLAAGAPGRASEDLLRHQRPTILTWNSDATLMGWPDALPETPVMVNGSFVEGSGSGSGGSRGSHRHSPSAPSQLSSYAASHVDRHPSGTTSSHPRSASASPSVAPSDHGETPPVPPQKDSYLSSTASTSSNGLLTPDVASLRSGASAINLSSSPQPHAVPRHDYGGVVGLGFESALSVQQRRPSRDVPRRPSMNATRTGTSSTTTSQHTTTGADDGGSCYDDTSGANKSSIGGGANAQGTLSGKRRLMRNFLIGIKNSATGSGGGSGGP